MTNRSLSCQSTSSSMSTRADPGVSRTVLTNAALPTAPTPGREYEPVLWPMTSSVRPDATALDLRVYGTPGDAGTARIGLQVPLCAVTDHAFDTESYRDHAVGKFLTADDMRWYWAHYLDDPAQGDDPLVSVLRADLHGMPAALVITAGLDPLRDEGEAYAHRLDAAGVATKLVRFDEMIHAFAVLSAFPEEQAALIADVAAAVDDHLRA